MRQTQCSVNEFHLEKCVQSDTHQRELRPAAARLCCLSSAEAMVATTAKDMARTVAEVQACKRMIQHKYIVGPEAASMEDLPPWPTLKPRPQRA